MLRNPQSNGSSSRGSKGGIGKANEEAQCSWQTGLDPFSAKSHTVPVRRHVPPAAHCPAAQVLVEVLSRLKNHHPSPFQLMGACFPLRAGWDKTQGHC